jgi:uncharacterized membrane protein
MNAVAVETHAKRARLIWGAVFVIAMGLAAGLINSLHLGIAGSFAIALVPMLLLIPFVRANERAQKEVGCATSATLRYNRRVLVMSFGYLLALFAALGITRQVSVHGPLLWILAILPSIPITGMVVTMGRFLIEETDEYQRMRMVRASLVATGFVLVLASLWGFLEMFGLVPHVWLWAVFPAWSIGLGVGQAANRWMFGDQAGC